jgi:hypothetical protein
MARMKQSHFPAATRGWLAGGLAAAGMVTAIAFTWPQPAGACSCAESGVKMELVGLTLVSSTDELDDAEAAALVEEEAVVWPDELWYDDYGTVWADVGVMMDLEAQQ